MHRLTHSSFVTLTKAKLKHPRYNLLTHPLDAPSRPTLLTPVLGGQLVNTPLYNHWHTLSTHLLELPHQLNSTIINTPSWSTFSTHLTNTTLRWSAHWHIHYTIYLHIDISSHHLTNTTPRRSTCRHDWSTNSRDKPRFTGNNTLTTTINFFFVISSISSSGTITIIVISSSSSSTIIAIIIIIDC